LLAALGQPQWPHHRTLPEKAATLHFAINRNHPYLDGNKRMALAAPDAFLRLNGGTLFASDADLVALALGVADGSITQEQNRAFFLLRCFRRHWTDTAIKRRFDELDQSVNEVAQEAALRRLERWQEARQRILKGLQGNPVPRSHRRGRAR